MNIDNKLIFVALWLWDKLFCYLIFFNAVKMQKVKAVGHIMEAMKQQELREERSK